MLPERSQEARYSLNPLRPHTHMGITRRKWREGWEWEPSSLQGQNAKPRHWWVLALVGALACVLQEWSGVEVKGAIVNAVDGGAPGEGQWRPLPGLLQRAGEKGIGLTSVCGQKYWCSTRETLGGTILAWATGRKGVPEGATADLSLCLVEAQVQDGIQKGHEPDVILRPFQL